MSMDVMFLGTGAAYPSPTRGASALVLRCEGECWLFDWRITKIFITHLHGDHYFGLSGLLCTISLQSGSVVTKQPIEIYGPAGLRDFIWRTMELSHMELVFPYVVHELVPTADQCPTEEQKEFMHENSYLLVDDEQFVVKAFRLFHRIPSFGFSDVEKKRPGPAYGKLKNGISVVLENGVTISPQDVLKKPIVGRKICILGDCSGVVGDGGVKLCFEADLLIHEATLDDAQMDKAKEHGHSTPQMAAAFAKLCQAKRLVLTHFSQRYKPVALAREGEADGIVELKKQAESVLDLQEVTLAEDFMVIGTPIKK
ncbi:unnamed protein product [Nyctereutes procyonoides]|uniref:(raccoon dog) hypothetical protein n=1 Tax=Nyctereutes procyonoides TaxID=34880 RepID=A0A811Z7M4_NYCPR|nr:unnamed protein product [Nyctereutes procyonoides]